jgi:hypothetical protein
LISSGRLLSGKAESSVLPVRRSSMPCTIIQIPKIRLNRPNSSARAIAPMWGRAQHHAERDRDQSGELRRRVGLMGLKDRVEALGGQFALRTERATARLSVLSCHSPASS